MLSLLISKPNGLQLIPGLQSLTITANKSRFEYILPFLGDSLRQLFILSSSDADLEKLDLVLQDIAQRSPGLTQVYISTKSPIVQSIIGKRTDLSRFILSLKSVQELHLLGHWPNARSLGAIGSLKSLRALVIGPRPHSTPPSLPVAWTRPIPLFPKSFISITTLKLSCSADGLMLPLFSQKRLRMLNLNEMELSMQGALPFVMERLCTGISRTCPNLKILILDLFNLSSPTAPLGISDTIYFKDILPLLACRSVRKFSIRHRLPLQIVSSELQRLVKAWKNIEDLEITPNPIPHNRLPAPSLKLSCLSSLGDAPQLQRLALYLDTSVIALERRSLRKALGLKVLSVGTSSIHDPLSVAIFLADRCNSDLVITGDHNCPTPHVRAARVGSGKGDWDECRRVFQQVVRARSRWISGATEDARREQISWKSALEREYERKLSQLRLETCTQLESMKREYEESKNCFVYAVKDLKVDDEETIVAGPEGFSFVLTSSKHLN